MTYTISEKTFGLAILGTFFSEKEWRPIILKFQDFLIKNKLAVPQDNELLFKEILIFPNKQNHGNDIILILNEEKLIEANFADLCKICQSPNPFQNVFDNRPKLPIFWIRDILDYFKT